jgi:diguanylate cyclase (GGDEF)-like protein
MAAGIVGSLIGAQTLARTKSDRTRHSFELNTAEIASRLNLGFQHEQDLAINASSLFAGDPKTSPAEIRAWSRLAQPLHRYPELDRLTLVALVPAAELPAFEERFTGKAPKPLEPRSSSPTEIPGFRVVPPGRRLYYCFAVGGLARGDRSYPPAGIDYCAHSTRLLRSRDSGRSTYTQLHVGGAQAVGVDTPIYRGDVTPSTVTGRRYAFLGWLREVLVPGVLLQQARLGRANDRVSLRHRSGSSNIVFTTGTHKANAQTKVVKLQNGWTLTSYGPSASASVRDDGQALALLIGGCALSVLVGLLVFILPTRVGRRRSVSKARGLQHADLYDPLTRLPNRVLTLDRAERMLARSRRQYGMLVGALFIDIDWLKDINDKLGQSAGDDLLKIVAERLGDVIRAQDTLGRLDGDEFVLLVESQGSGVRLEGLARRVIEALHKPIMIDGFGPSFLATASIGVAFGRYTAIDDLLRDARLALDSAKAAGRDRYTVFNANLRAVIEGRGLLEADLNTAIQEGQLSLLYQPIFDLMTRRVAGVEALVRWHHPTQGDLPLSDFLPLAEETDLIMPLGRWVLEEACSQAAAWSVAGHPIGVSVNVSGRQLIRPGFLTDVQRALQRSGIQPFLLTLDIAEPTVTVDFTAAAERLDEIKQLGVRVAIDDFGEGYAQRSKLHQLPLDVLKVNRLSVAESEDEEYRNWLLEAILALGRELSLSVLVKGVETYEQMAAIEAMGFAMAQGFFFGKPMPADAVESMFDATATWEAPSPSPGAPMTPSADPFGR